MKKQDLTMREFLFAVLRRFALDQINDTESCWITDGWEVSDNKIKIIAPAVKLRLSLFDVLEKELQKALQELISDKTITVREEGEFIILEDNRAEKPNVIYLPEDYYDVKKVPYTWHNVEHLFYERHDRPFKTAKLKKVSKKIIREGMGLDVFEADAEKVEIYPYDFSEKPEKFILVHTHIADETFVCSECGRRMWKDNGVHTNGFFAKNGEWYCWQCWDKIQIKAVEQGTIAWIKEMNGCMFIDNVPILVYGDLPDEYVYLDDGSENFVKRLSEEMGDYIHLVALPTSVHCWYDVYGKLKDIGGYSQIYRGNKILEVGFWENFDEKTKEEIVEAITECAYVSCYHPNYEKIFNGKDFIEITRKGTKIVNIKVTEKLYDKLIKHRPDEETWKIVTDITHIIEFRHMGEDIREAYNDLVHVPKHLRNSVARMLLANTNDNRKIKKMLAFTPQAKSVLAILPMVKGAKVARKWGELARIDGEYMGRLKLKKDTGEFIYVEPDDAVIFEKETKEVNHE